MPVFSISLTKLIDSAASEAMATMSLGLFNSLKEKECSLVKGFHRSSVDYLYSVLQSTNISISFSQRKRTLLQCLNRRKNVGGSYEIQWSGGLSVWIILIRWEDRHLQFLFPFCSIKILVFGFHFSQITSHRILQNSLVFVSEYWHVVHLFVMNYGYTK